MELCLDLTQLIRIRFANACSRNEHPYPLATGMLLGRKGCHYGSTPIKTSGTAGTPRPCRMTFSKSRS